MLRGFKALSWISSRLVEDSIHDDLFVFVAIRSLFLA